MRTASGVLALVAVLSLGSAACRNRSGNDGGAAPPTVSSETAQAPTSAVPQVGPVTEADVAEVGDVLRRLDGVLDRLDSDMAAGEGDGQEPGAETTKALATGAVTRRLLALRELTTFAKAVPRLRETDRTVLTDQLQAQVNGLTALNGRIQGAADPATIRADASRMVTDYRVYALTVPRTRALFATDVVLFAVERFTALTDRFTVTVNQAQIKGKDTAGAVAALSDLQTAISAVSGAVSPLPGVLLALHPSDYPGTQAALEQARLTLRTGRTGLADAARLAHRLIAAAR